MFAKRHAPGQQRRVDQVTPGYYRLRLVKAGWQVPAQIAREGKFWFAVLNGETGDLAVNPFAAQHVEKIHSYGSVITQAEYVWLLAMREWAAEHDPIHPCLHPYQPIDPMRLRPIHPSPLEPRS